MLKPANWLEDISSVYDPWTGAAIKAYTVKYLSSSPMTTLKLKKKARTSLAHKTNTVGTVQK